MLMMVNDADDDGRWLSEGRVESPVNLLLAQHLQKKNRR
jgi:hypothetical protein